MFGTGAVQALTLKPTERLWRAVVVDAEVKTNKEDHSSE
jgi:hypothetical protein